MTVLLVCKYSHSFTSLVLDSIVKASSTLQNLGLLGLLNFTCFVCWCFYYYCYCCCCCYLNCVRGGVRRRKRSYWHKDGAFMFSDCWQNYSFLSLAVILYVAVCRLVWMCWWRKLGVLFHVLKQASVFVIAFLLV